MSIRDPFDVPQNYMELPPRFDLLPAVPPVEPTPAVVAPLQPVQAETAAGYGTPPPRHLRILYKPKPDEVPQHNPLVQELYALDSRWVTWPVLKTTADDSFLDELESRLEDNTDIVIFAGDGTASRTMARLQASGRKGIRVVLVANGTACDMAHMAGGEQYCRDPAAVLQWGVEEEWHPLRMTYNARAENGQQPVVKTVQYVGGSGANAIASREADKTTHRERQRERAAKKLGPLLVKWSNLRLGAYSALSSPTFRLVAEQDQGKTGWLRNVFSKRLDLMFAAGNRVAGGEVTTPIQPNNATEFAVSETRNRIHSVLWQTVKYKLGISRTHDQRHDGTYTVYLREPTRFAGDGEYEGMVPAGVLEVCRAEESTTMLTMHGADAPAGRVRRLRIPGQRKPEDWYTLLHEQVAA